MIKNFHFKVIIFSLILLPLSGCSLNGNQKQVLSDGGLYKTVNQGVSWAQKGLIASVQARQMSIALVNNASFAMDPSDSQALYFGSIGNGLFYSYDGGESWQKSKDLGNASIRSMAVAPDEKCRIYAALNNRLYRSRDCNRTYEQIYYDNELAATVDAVAIDKYNSNNVFIGISRGDLVKSSDQGDSWQTIYRFGDKIAKIIIDPNDTRRMYLTTSKKGLFFSSDSGLTWASTNDMLKDEKLGTEIRDIIITEGEAPEIFIATTYGMLRSADRGETWEQIELIQPEKKATINALAVNPQNTKEIYYVTYTTFFRSVDGGKNWSTLKLPTTRAGWRLLIDPKEPKTIYMAVRGFE